ncbi:PorT family protein [Marinilongibacter aquaticus]|uniref:porin family protein n=1 Tax=Marinilongibacter aquaticus TaxID=2975157 RepID=UPI0021BD1284|nr:porin family protein [Marinilongibacter aquaticus]UBM60134.1 PorT family protein [Marinilongibacter aquaticus]
MKKIFLLIAALIGIQTANAQGTIGFKGGVSGSTMTKFDLLDNLTPDFKLAPAFTGILFYEIPINENFSIQPEVSYLNRGFRIDEKVDIGQVLSFLGSENSFNVNADLGKFDLLNSYIQVPVLAKMKFGEPGGVRGYGMIGPELSFLMDSQLRANFFGLYKNKFDMPKGIYKDVDFGAVAALGVEIPVGPRFQIIGEARYDLGITRTLDIANFQLDVRNRSLSGLIGFQYQIGAN